MGKSSFGQIVTLSLALLSGSFFLASCAGSPSLQDSSLENSTSTGDTNPDGLGRNRTSDRDFPNPDIPCSAGGVNETFSIMPSSIRGANIVFLIDDSGSMGDEIQKVIYEVGGFLNQINLATRDNYRVSLVFDHTTSVFNRQFTFANGQPIDRNLYPNPLQPYISASNGRISYFKSMTWSKWADIAFFKAFAQADFSQLLPQVVPADEPPAGTTIYNASTCSGSGKWFRPRFNQYLISNFNATPGCFTANAGARFQDYHLANIAVNFISLTDDDMNVNYAGRVNNLHKASSLTWSDANPQYPEITYNMLRKTLLPIGSDVPILYHSIIGLDADRADVEEVGQAHWALSKKTGGAIHDITAATYTDAFNQIAKKVIFSEQVVSLACSIPSGGAPVVRLDGRTLSSGQFSITNGGKDIRLGASAFMEGDENKNLRVDITF